MTKKQQFICKKCEAIEFIPENMNGIKLKDITVVYCPNCKRKTKMIPVGRPVEY